MAYAGAFAHRESTVRPERGFFASAIRMSQKSTVHRDAGFSFVGVVNFLFFLSDRSQMRNAWSA